MNPSSTHRFSRPFVEGWLVVGLCIFMAAFYVLPPGKMLNNVYYALALPPALFLIIKEREVFSGSFIGATILLLLAYVSVSTWWGDNASLKQWLHSLKHFFYVICFIFAISYLYRRPNDFWLVLRIVLLAACIGGGINVWEWYFEGHAHGRLAGKVAPQNSVDLGVAYGFAALLAVSAFFMDHRFRWLHAVFSVLLIIALFMTQTRVAIVAFVVSVLPFFILPSFRRQAFVMGALLLSMIIIGVYSGYFERFTLALSGASGIQARVWIWEEVFRMVKEQSILWGAGLNTPTEFYVPKLKRTPFTTTHNLFVGTFFIGGAIALLLVATLLFQAFWGAIKKILGAANPLPFSLLVYAVLASLAHGTRIIGQPSDVWMFWWLPIGVALAVVVSQRQHTPVKE